MKLTGKVCLITGGLSGIGAATAFAFARRGAHISVACRTHDAPALNRLRAEVESSGGKFHFVQADLGTVDGCRRSVEETNSALASVDVIVHSAGSAAPGNLLEVTEEQWLKAFDVHVHAIFRLCKSAVPLMKSRGEGAIVLISSVAGLRGCLGSLAYGAVKGTLPQFSRALARELADDNIRVNCVSPGVIRTPFQKFLKPEQVENNLKNRIPLHREGKPEDVANVIVELVANEFITGENVVIDGGMSMRVV